jgi:hypothetical protein
MRIKFNFLFILLIWSLQTGCLYVARYDGNYSGRVVDQETREPIEGAVVLGTWYRVEPTVAGGVSYYYDARETLTDKNGEFSIPGLGLRIMGSIKPMSALIYKAGYWSYETGTWSTIKEGLYSSEQVKWEEGNPIFPIRRLSGDDRKKYSIPSRPTIPIAKMKLMTEEINKERIIRGLEPFDMSLIK